MSFSRLAIVVALTSCACAQRTVATERSESEAIEISDVLTANQIFNEKVLVEGKQKPTFNVVVSRAQLEEATAVLRRHRLPRRHILVTGEDEPGMVPNSELIKARNRAALQGDIVSGLLKIDGVVDASCLLSVPEPSPFADPSDPVPPPRASVLVHYIAKDGSAPIDEQGVKRFVAPSVPKLQPESVEVRLIQVASVTPAAGPVCAAEPFLGARICSEDRAAMVAGASVSLAITALLAGLLVLVAFRLWHYRSDVTRLTRQISDLRRRVPSHVR